MSRGPLLFNPREAGDAELEQTFVARHPLLEELLRGLRDDVGSSRRRHGLLLGPRGSGKSHLTELIARRLRAEGWRVARLPEEQYRVTAVGRLMQQILISFGGAAIEGGVQDDATLEDRSLDALRRLASDGRPMLVVLENLGELLEQRLSRREEQARLRKILLHDAPFVLLATSPMYAEPLSAHDAPFFDFFQVRELRDLSSDDVVTLLRQRAAWDLPAEHPLRQQDGLVTSRVRALYHLCGGNPRLVLMLYDVLRAGLEAALRDQLLGLLDEVTPYYRDRLRDLSGQMRQLLTELCLSDRNLTPARLAERCGLPTNQVTAILKRLEEARIVEPGERVDKRSRYWIVRERLLRIWMQMRERPEDDGKLAFLVEFFEAWYEGHSGEAVTAAEGFGANALAAIRDRRVPDVLSMLASMRMLHQGVRLPETALPAVLGRLLNAQSDEALAEALKDIVARVPDGADKQELVAMWAAVELRRGGVGAVVPMFEQVGVGRGVTDAAHELAQLLAAGDVDAAFALLVRWLTDRNEERLVGGIAGWGLAAAAGGSVAALELMLAVRWISADAAFAPLEEVGLHRLGVRPSTELFFVADQLRAGASWRAVEGRARALVEEIQGGWSPARRHLVPLCFIALSSENESLRGDLNIAFGEAVDAAVLGRLTPLEFACACAWICQTAEPRGVVSERTAQRASAADWHLCLSAAVRSGHPGPAILNLYDRIRDHYPGNDARVPLLEEALEVRRSIDPAATLASFHPELREAVERILSSQLPAEERMPLAAEPG